MIALVQRVIKASVSISNNEINRIDQGLVVLLGVKEADTEKQAKFLAEKTAHLRVMSDENDKMNLSVIDAKGSILVISQFTLAADCSAGRRPSFIRSAKPDLAQKLYNLYISELKKYSIKKVVTGKFGAYMKVEIINDGPVTIIIDSEDRR